MKNSILVLGILAATGLAFLEAPGVRASEWRQSSIRFSKETWTELEETDEQYEGTNEDGEREPVETGQ
ncbi:MAG: hypothetical protein F6J93_39920 [Oscillatoria sp. SIO1A7]|nr:hypothetical protein [Oscillatoria sp. SIO1A7]